MVHKGVLTRYSDGSEPANAPSPGQRSQLHLSQQMEAHFTGRGSPSSLGQSILFPLLLEREFIPKLEHPVGGDLGAAALTLGVHPGPGNELALLIYILNILSLSFIH